MQTFYNFKSAYYVIFPDHWFIDKTWEIDLKQTESINVLNITVKLLIQS